MVCVVFEQLRVADPAPIAHRVAGPVRLLDLCDELGAPIPFSCRDASCGTCLVEVREGGSLLDRPGVDELRLLARLGQPSDTRRLACRARLVAREGTLRLVSIGER